MENKTGRYFKYAIGEIILVVIGILIALQINNWNEQRKLNNEEQSLLKDLNSEFKINLENLKNNMLINQENQKAVAGLLDLIQQKNMEENTNKLDSLFMVVFSYGSFNTTSGVLNEVINSGKLRIIKDDSLRKNLTQWPGKIDNMVEDIIIRRDQMNFQLQPFYSKHAPIKNGNKYMSFASWSDKYEAKKMEDSNFGYNIEALESREFEGHLYKYLLDQDFVIMNDIELHNFIELILTQINQNLAK
ncbi:DUF6090 family protein [Formosa maritima]|uniref:DUF6090 family protein n=1 Tax=Formosa maritima TaxID=2592046 RepID=UPI0018F58208|nr:DUF6090 family protein [Formosa maritima]